ncbi:MAG: DUF494 family protein [Candidatus Zixiibacteriota bacterium]|nr:MAG: DUF494 family protein [candidate division Zixibacteria bacterium]
MYHRIMELLVLLMDEFGGGSLQTEQMDHISEDLLSRGYTEQEISAAFFWLYHRFGEEHGDASPARDFQPPADTSHRALNSIEQRYISPEAFGYLLQLRHVGLISMMEMEKILERAMLLGLVPVGLDEMKLITQAELFGDGRLWSAGMSSASNKGDTVH